MFHSLSWLKHFGKKCVKIQYFAQNLDNQEKLRIFTFLLILQYFNHENVNCVFSIRSPESMIGLPKA